jgi:hypothetical protein
VTDGSCRNLWQTIDSAVVQCGYPSLQSKTHLPLWLLYPIAYLGSGFTALTGNFVKLTPVRHSPPSGLLPLLLFSSSPSTALTS